MGFVQVGNWKKSTFEQRFVVIPEEPLLNV